MDRKLLTNIGLIALAVALVIGVQMSRNVSTVQASADKDCVCHAAGPPPTQYICLHRNCLDVVHSLMELFRYGFPGRYGQLVAQSPDNNQGPWAALENYLRTLLPADHIGIASINSPMQCMMKEICAQCLCKHRDPLTGKESFVFSCFDQDQPMDVMDWENLRMRLRGNSLHEKLTALWLEYLLERAELPRV